MCVYIYIISYWLILIYNLIVLKSVSTHTHLADPYNTFKEGKWQVVWSSFTGKERKAWRGPESGPRLSSILDSNAVCMWAAGPRVLPISWVTSGKSPNLSGPPRIWTSHRYHLTVQTLSFCNSAPSGTLLRQGSRWPKSLLILCPLSYIILPLHLSPCFFTVEQTGPN